jgi:hypothetical protein
MKKNQATTLKELVKKNKLTSLKNIVTLKKDKNDKINKTSNIDSLDITHNPNINNSHKSNKRRIFFTSSSKEQGTTTSLLNLSTLLSDHYEKKTLCTTFNDLNNVKKMQDFFFSDIFSSIKPTPLSKTIRYNLDITESIQEFEYSKNLYFLNNDFFSHIKQLNSIANEAFNKTTKFFYKSDFDFMLIDIALNKLIEIDISSSEEIIVVSTLDEEDLKENYSLAKKLLQLTPNVSLFFNNTHSINNLDIISKKIELLSDNKIKVIGSILKSDIVNFNSTRNNPFFVKKNIELPFFDLYKSSIKKIFF